MFSADKILQLYLVTVALWFAAFLIGAYHQNETRFGLVRVWMVKSLVFVGALSAFASFLGVTIHAHKVWELPWYLVLVAGCMQAFGVYLLQWQVMKLTPKVWFPDDSKS